MEDIRENGGVLDHALQKIPEAAVKGGRLFPANSLLVATSATIGEHALVTVPHLSNQRFTSLAVKSEYVEQIDMKFVYYYGFVLDEWCRDNTTTSSFSSVDMTGFKRFRFPVPPLEVQREIVRILDQFTQLEAELEAELEARGRQYEHYSRELLSIAEDVGWTTLGEATENHDRKRRPVTRSDREGGDYPYYGANGVQDFVDEFIFDGTFLLVGEDGSVKRADGTPVLNWASGKIWVNNHAHVLTSASERFNLRYLFHYLKTVDISPLVSGGTQPKLNQRNLNQIAIPLVARQEQDRVVEILDKFDALVNDLSVGLPAELAARRKQYEYYRDKLLTFEEASA
jgi:type I restriction enzyme S subunit